VLTHTRKLGEIAGFRPRVPKRVLLFLLSTQCGLSATYPAPISTIFETTDANRFAHAYTGENVRISAQGFFHVPKHLISVDSRVCVIELQVKRSESFRGLVDIPTMCLLTDFCYGTYRFGAI